MSTGKIAFEPRMQEVEVAKLLPTKVVKEPQNIRCYRRIVDSLPELGLIEPLMVYPQKSGENWLVLDGHLREHHGELLAEFETIAAAESL